MGVCIGPAVKRVEFFSDKLPDIMLTDQRCDIIAGNFSDPTKGKNYESNDYIWSWSRYSILFLSTT